VKQLIALLFVLAALLPGPAMAGDTDIRSAQATIAAQIKAFLADDNAAAYSYASPEIQRIFPTVDAFMGMVKRAYQPVWHPQSYAFGKVEQTSPTSIVQQVLVVGPDGRGYEAVYTLERQSDGVFRITGVSLRASNALST
jgi:hypothetical protein